MAADNVNGGTEFERLPADSGGGRRLSARMPSDLHGRLDELVVQRFRRLTDLEVIVIPSEFAVPGRTEALPADLLSALCRAFTGRGRCATCWQAHVAELAAHRVTHWHACAHDCLCAVVPVTLQDSILAVCKLTCPSSVGRSDFRRHVELLQVLVENVLSTLSGVPAQPPATTAPAASPAHPSSPAHGQAAPGQVRQAIEYVERHLTDPGLTVAAVARHLGANPAYLAHVFSDQTGTHLGHYISACRIERAKNLLASTDWQIKRVAHECGLPNPDWFSQVFRARTGMTPTEYRRARSTGTAPPSAPEAAMPDRSADQQPPAAPDTPSWESP